MMLSSKTVYVTFYHPGGRSLAVTNVITPPAPPTLIATLGPCGSRGLFNGTLGRNDPSLGEGISHLKCVCFHPSRKWLSGGFIRLFLISWACSEWGALVTNESWNAVFVRAEVVAFFLGVIFLADVAGAASIDRWRGGTHLLHTKTYRTCAVHQKLWESCPPL